MTGLSPRRSIPRHNCSKPANSSYPSLRGPGLFFELMSCLGCIVDPNEPTSPAQQIAACPSRACALFDFRPTAAELDAEVRLAGAGDRAERVLKRNLSAIHARNSARNRRSPSRRSTNPSSSEIATSSHQSPLFDECIRDSAALFKEDQLRASIIDPLAEAETAVCSPALWTESVRRLV